MTVYVNMDGKPVKPHERVNVETSSVTQTRHRNLRVTKSLHEIS